MERWLSINVGWPVGACSLQALVIAKSAPPLAMCILHPTRTLSLDWGAVCPQVLWLGRQSLRSSCRDSACKLRQRCCPWTGCCNKPSAGHFLRGGTRGDLDHRVVDAGGPGGAAEVRLQVRSFHWFFCSTMVTPFQTTCPRYSTVGALSWLHTPERIELESVGHQY